MNYSLEFYKEVIVEFTDENKFYQMSRPIDYYITARYDLKNQVWRSFLSDHILNEKDITIKGWSEIEKI